ncbi:MAG TPA: hypothetical protein VMS43_16685 [Allosphingosinicella sp.]|nr:hypothetical protein [Allosphingosinicella sp.]
MRAVLALFALAGLAACATAVLSGGQPTREELAAALRAWMTCDAAVATNCASPPEEITVRTLRCRPGEGERQAQMLCKFSYGAGYPWHPPLSECAWLSRDGDGAWRIDSYPDADVCESWDA